MIYVTYVLDHMAVIADEEECTTLWQVDLHSDQAVGVTWQMVESDTLAEIKAALVESLPVPVMTGQSLYFSIRQPFLIRLGNKTYKSNFR